MRRVIQRQIGAVAVSGLILFASTAAWAEKVEIVTYYPSPAAPASATTETPPAKPYTARFVVYKAQIDSNYTYRGVFDVYETLHLWQFGVKRSQVVMSGWTAYAFGDVTYGAPTSLAFVPGQGVGSPIGPFPSGPICLAPLMKDGVVYVGGYQRQNVQPLSTVFVGDVYEVTVTW